MPYELTLPDPWPSRQWKVKILDRERLEPPHVTIMNRTRRWRVNLRDGEFMSPPGGSKKDIPKEVWECVERAWDELGEAWDRMYPSNPIRSEDE